MSEEFICLKCKKSFKSKHSLANHKRWYNPKFRIDIQGEKNPNWKGGTYKYLKGYIYVYSPHHPYCNVKKYVLKHRLVVEEQLKRFLKPTEIVHHINGNKEDNRIKNLQILSKSEHSKIHSKGKNNGNWKGGIYVKKE